MTKEPEHYNAAHLASLPTIAVGQDADLKFESDTVRVWLSRLTKDDGRKGTGVIVERLRADGTWS